ncbi:MAG: flagellin [Clostridiaceae bacterium]|jgi:flagellin|nr:flagellin [Clostridiaceae bacterium]
MLEVTLNLRLNHNLASLNIYTRYNKTLTSQSISMERISSGIKLNSSKDDPNAIAQSERMRMQIRGLQMAGRNAQDGVSMLQSAEGGLEGMTNMLQRARELVVQAANGTYNQSDRATAQKEIDAMIDGVTDLAKNTGFNGVNLLSSGSAIGSGPQTYIETVIGANSGENIKIPTYDLTAGSLTTTIGMSTVNLNQVKNGGSYDIATAGHSTDSALQIIDSALNNVIEVRSKYGALENRLSDTSKNLSEMSDTITGAESSIRDSDIAEEMMNYTKDSILADAANALMAQTNKMPQDILRVLDNLRSK